MKRYNLRSQSNNLSLIGNAVGPKEQTIDCAIVENFEQGRRRPISKKPNLHRAIGRLSNISESVASDNSDNSFASREDFISDSDSEVAEVAKNIDVDNDELHRLEPPSKNTLYSLSLSR